MAYKTKIDIRATDEERTSLLKYMELCSKLGVEVDSKEIRDPFFNGHDLELVPSRGDKPHDYIRTARSSKAEIAKQR
jgi:hypothetical protein